jgi:hypothetical protein
VDRKVKAIERLIIVKPDHATNEAVEIRLFAISCG